MGVVAEVGDDLARLGGGVGSVSRAYKDLEGTVRYLEGVDWSGVTEGLVDGLLDKAEELNRLSEGLEDLVDDLWGVVNKAEGKLGG